MEELTFFMSVFDLANLMERLPKAPFKRSSNSHKMPVKLSESFLHQMVDEAPEGIYRPLAIEINFKYDIEVRKWHLDDKRIKITLR